MRVRIGDLDDGWRVRRGVGQENDAPLVGSDVTDGPPSGFPFFQQAIVQSHAADVPRVILRPGTDQVLMIQVVVRVQAQFPVGV